MKTHLCLSAVFCLFASLGHAQAGDNLVLPPPPPVGGSSVAPAANSSGESPTSAIFDDISTSAPQSTNVAVEKGTISLGSSPQLTAGPRVNPQQARASVGAPVAAPAINALSAEIAEATFPQVVRRQDAGYAPMNVPPGWKLQPLRSLQFNPAPVVKFANGEEYTVQSSPFVLVPANESTRTSVNPRALQVLHNYYLAQVELMRQMRDALKVNGEVTKIE